MSLRYRARLHKVAPSRRSSKACTVRVARRLT
jgi:hypothetical protein